MRSSVNWLFLAALITAIAHAGSANAADVMSTKSIGSYRVELQVLPAEPFFSRQDVAAKHLTEGMEIEGGASPVMLDAPSHPNHHLVVHVYDKRTGQAFADAVVTMNFVPLDRRGSPEGAAVEVPVVVMQAIGKGPASTHYGNNVTMPAGRYRVTVTVNGKKAVFTATVSDTPTTPMGHMKM
jgi:hypothetical protein